MKTMYANEKGKRDDAPFWGRFSLALYLLVALAGPSFIAFGANTDSEAVTVELTIETFVSVTIVDQDSLTVGGDDAETIELGTLTTANIASVLGGGTVFKDGDASISLAANVPVILSIPKEITLSLTGSSPALAPDVGVAVDLGAVTGGTLLAGTASMHEIRFPPSPSTEPPGTVSPAVQPVSLILVFNGDPDILSNPAGLYSGPLTVTLMEE